MLSGLFLASFFMSILVNYLQDYSIAENTIFRIVNRGLAFSSAISITLSYLLGHIKLLGISISSKIGISSKYFGVYGFSVSALHSFVSLMLLSQERYPYLFSDKGVFNIFGEMTMLFGVVTISLLMLPAISSIPSVSSSMNVKTLKRFRKIGYLALISIVFHSFFVNSNFFLQELSHSRFYLLFLFTIWGMILLTLVLKSISYTREQLKRTKAN